MSEVAATAGAPARFTHVRILGERVQVESLRRLPLPGRVRMPLRLFNATRFRDARQRRRERDRLALELRQLNDLIRDAIIVLGSQAALAPQPMSELRGHVLAVEQARASANTASTTATESHRRCAEIRASLDATLHQAAAVRAERDRFAWESGRLAQAQDVASAQRRLEIAREIDGVNGELTRLERTAADLQRQLDIAQREVVVAGTVGGGELAREREAVQTLGWEALRTGRVEGVDPSVVAQAKELVLRSVVVEATIAGYDQDLASSPAPSLAADWVGTLAALFSAFLLIDGRQDDGGVSTVAWSAIGATIGAFMIPPSWRWSSVARVGAWGGGFVAWSVAGESIDISGAREVAFSVVQIGTVFVVFFVGFALLRRRDARLGNIALLALAIPTAGLTTRVVLGHLAHREAHAQLRQQRDDALQRAEDATAQARWDNAWDALREASSIEPLSAEERVLEQRLVVERAIESFCLGDMETVMSLEPALPGELPATIAAQSVPRGRLLFSSRESIRRLRELSSHADAIESSVDDEQAGRCREAIKAFNSSSIVRFQVLRDLGGGSYEIVDSVGQRAHLMTALSRFRPGDLGELRLSVIDADPPMAVEVLADSQELADCQRALAALERTKNAVEQARRNLQSELSRESKESVSQCRAVTTARGPAAPSPAAPPVSVTPLTPPPEAATWAPDAVARFVEGQARLLSSGADVLAGALSEHAAVWLPHALRAYEGRDAIEAGVSSAWPSIVDVKVTSPVIAGIAGEVAWATTTWAIDEGDVVTTVRVTEVIALSAGKATVVAASFSEPRPEGSRGLAGPVPDFVGGAAATVPDTWLASPRELAAHLHNDPATAIFGSDADEYATGSTSVGALLARWEGLQLEIVGDVLTLGGAGHQTVLAFVRWRGRQMTLFRVLALFVLSDDGEPELATVQYSVAVSNDLDEYE